VAIARTATSLNQQDSYGRLELARLLRRLLTRHLRGFIMVTRGWIVGAALSFGALISASSAIAGPVSISTCTVNGDGVTQTCNFYETDANAAPSEISSPVNNLFQSTSFWADGYSAIDDPNGTLSDIIVWSQTAGTGTLFSCDDGTLSGNCNTNGLTLLGTGFENANGDLLGASKARHLATGAIVVDTLNIFSPPENVPEPLTLSLFGAGLAGAVAMRRRRRKNQL